MSPALSLELPICRVAIDIFASRRGPRVAFEHRKFTRFPRRCQTQSSGTTLGTLRGSLSRRRTCTTTLVGTWILTSLKTLLRLRRWLLCRSFVRMELVLRSCAFATRLSRLSWVLRRVSARGWLVPRIRRRRLCDAELEHGGEDAVALRPEELRVTELHDSAVFHHHQQVVRLHRLQTMSDGDDRAPTQLLCYHAFNPGIRLFILKNSSDLYSLSCYLI